MVMILCTPFFAFSRVQMLWQKARLDARPRVGLDRGIIAVDAVRRNQDPIHHDRVVTKTTLIVPDHIIFSRTIATWPMGSRLIEIAYYKRLKPDNSLRLPESCCRPYPCPGR